MSVKVMTAVFDRYPNGGSEMLLALALADHAHDDGTHIYPGITHLAEKTRQTERNVQKLLRKMQEAGWLVAVGFAHGGRSMRTQYRISPEWIKGENFSPFQKGELEGQKGELEGQKGELEGIKRVNAGSPAINHQESSKKHQEANPRADALGLPAVSDHLLSNWEEARKPKRCGPITEAVAKDLLRESAKAGVPAADAIEMACARGWVTFRADWFMADQQSAKAAGIEPAAQAPIRTPDPLPEPLPPAAPSVVAAGLAQALKAAKTPSANKGGWAQRILSEHQSGKKVNPTRLKDARAALKGMA